MTKNKKPSKWMFSKQQKLRQYQQQTSTKGYYGGQRDIFLERGVEIPIGVVIREISKFVHIFRQTLTA